MHENMNDQRSLDDKVSLASCSRPSSSSSCSDAISLESSGYKPPTLVACEPIFRLEKMAGENKCWDDALAEDAHDVPSKLKVKQR